jgi:hypothetical protein
LFNFSSSNKQKAIILQVNEATKELFTIQWEILFMNAKSKLDNLQKDEDHFKVKLIEQEFKRLMFNE